MALNINRLHKFNDLVCELSAVKIIFKIADASGEGGGSAVRTPADRGEGGQKLGKFCGRPLWMPPNPFSNYQTSSLTQLANQRWSPIAQVLGISLLIS